MSRLKWVKVDAGHPSRRLSARRGLYYSKIRQGHIVLSSNIGLTLNRSHGIMDYSWYNLVVVVRIHVSNCSISTRNKRASSNESAVKQGVTHARIHIQQYQLRTKKSTPFIKKDVILFFRENNQFKI